MKRLATVTIMAALAALFCVSGAHADGHRGWGHQHRHHHGHPYGRGGYVERMIYERPLYIHEHHYRPPRVVHHYYEVPVVYERRYPIYHDHRLSGALPIIAGGVLGGVLGEQLGYGNHGAIIGGSVLGSVLGAEMSH